MKEFSYGMRLIFEGFFKNRKSEKNLKTYVPVNYCKRSYFPAAKFCASILAVNSEAKLKVARHFFEKIIITLSTIGQFERARCQSVVRNI